MYIGTRKVICERLKDIRAKFDEVQITNHKTLHKAVFLRKRLLVKYIDHKVCVILVPPALEEI